MNGQLMAKRDYKQELEQFFNDNYANLAPEEFEDGINAITQRYISGATNHWLEGFLPIAAEVEQHYAEKYNQAQRELIRTQSLDLVRTDAAESVRAYVQDLVLDRIGLGSLDEILTNPEAYTLLGATDFAEIVRPALRQQLTALQKASAPLGLTKSEVSSIFAEEVSKLAVKYGLPEPLSLLMKEMKAV